MKRSVIIPTANALARVEQTLASLMDLQCVPDEVIVVQNGLSENDRRENGTQYIAVAERFQSIGLKFFYDNVPGLLSGRHRGAREATGELLVFIDDDVTFSPNWLAELASVFDDPEIVLAGGPSRPVFECDPPQWMARYWQPTPCGGRQMAQLSLLELAAETVVTIDPDLV